MVRELAAWETRRLRREVSADGRTDLPTMHHELDDSPGAWHLGAVDEDDRVVAISSLYVVPRDWRLQAQPAVQLQNMAVEPGLQRQGIGAAVMSEILCRLRATDAVLLWANARHSSLPFYRRFGFEAVPDSALTGSETGRLHHVIVLPCLAGAWGATRSCC